MKTKFKSVVGRAVVYAGFVFFSLVAVSAVSLTGCGTSAPTDAEVERIPDVPPLRRGVGGVIEQPNQEK